jgi:hypothetical protein
MNGLSSDPGTGLSGTIRAGQAAGNALRCLPVTQTAARACPVQMPSSGRRPGKQLMILMKP